MGEDCVGRRHFDCIGFVNYCVAKVLARPLFGIAHYRSASTVGARIVEDQSFMNGDILVKGRVDEDDEDDEVNHIGIVAIHKKYGAIVINAAGMRVGLISQKLDAREIAKWPFHVRFK